MLEQWHSFTDSDAFRRVTTRGPGRAFLRSQTFRSLNLARNNVRTRAAIARHPGTFDDVKTFCFFVGHNKSGASLLGGLLDAHPDVLLSDEVDALQYVDAGFACEQVYQMILKGSQAEARKGRITARRLVPYSYWVPGGWQGRCRTPLVVGDSTTGTSTRRIAA
ncbi:MAG: hypothetical protein H0U16_00235, partial [Actinobacteria bacterium]|nr:hypothetical protein [Actinomycetota bacterium]